MKKTLNGKSSNRPNSQPSSSPKRGEIWLVSLDPTKGAEIRKTRPAVIVSSDHLGILPLKLIVPITEWNDRFAGNSWHVRVSPSPTNGLDKEGALDVLQTRSVDVARFVRKLGFLSADLMEEIAASIALVVEYT